MKKFFLPIVIFLIVSGCEIDDMVQIPKDMSGVYISGHHLKFTTPTTSKTWIWRNGTKTILSDVGYSIISDIFVSDNSVYAVGTEILSNSTNLKFWKDGTATTIQSTRWGQFTSVFVSGSDVYIGGFEMVSPTNYTVAKLWKNGVATVIAGSPGYSAEIFDVKVYKGDVYLAGRQFVPALQQFVAKVWKNGIGTDLTAAEGAAVEIQFSDAGDVYLLGRKEMRSAVWKNGSLQQWFTMPSTHLTVNSIFIKGTDVYLTGNKYVSAALMSVPILWKNGVETILTNSGYSYANAVFVKGKDVYVAGEERLAGGGKSLAILWKNGDRIVLTDSTYNTIVTDLFIK
jgi:hypothetical protein